MNLRDIVTRFSGIKAAIMQGDNPDQNNRPLMARARYSAKQVLFYSIAVLAIGYSALQLTTTSTEASAARCCTDSFGCPDDLLCYKPDGNLADCSPLQKNYCRKPKPEHKADLPAAADIQADSANFTVTSEGGLEQNQ